MSDITKSYSHTLGVQSLLSFWSEEIPQTQKTKTKKFQEHLRLTLTKKKVTEKYIVYVQMHILYTSVHPAAAEPTAREAGGGGPDGKWWGGGHVWRAPPPPPLCKQRERRCEAAPLGPLCSVTAETNKKTRRSVQCCRQTNDKNK